MNVNILYDYHDRNKIELAYHIDSTTGRGTCFASCEHCFLRNNTNVAGHHQDIAEATRMVGLLRDQGYSVLPIVSDSFAYEGKYLEYEFFKPFYDSNCSMAWTSGMPLLQGDSVRLLQLAVENGIEMIVMTSHGIEDKKSPFKGIIQPSYVKKAVESIQRFNRQFSKNIRTTLTFTIGKWNLSCDVLQSYIEYCGDLGVDVIRFNQFMDYQNKYSQYALEKEDIVTLYRNLNDIYNLKQNDVQLSISEDFGFHGIEVLGFPDGVGDCAACESFFGVVYPYVYACPELLEIVVGEIDDNGRIQWSEDTLVKLKKVKKHEAYSGCFGISFVNNAEFKRYVLSELGQRVVVDA